MVHSISAVARTSRRIMPKRLTTKAHPRPIDDVSARPGPAVVQFAGVTVFLGALTHGHESLTRQRLTMRQVTRHLARHRCQMTQMSAGRWQGLAACATRRPPRISRRPRPFGGGGRTASCCGDTTSSRQRSPAKDAWRARLGGLGFRRRPAIGRSAKRLTGDAPKLLPP
jgi:hypothetical protein